MIPATPHSELKREIENEIKPLKKFFNPKIIERPGPRLIDVLQSKVKKPSKSKNCRTETTTCMIRYTEGVGDCRSNEIVYEMDSLGETIFIKIHLL